jgi:hypothetical protein
MTILKGGRLAAAAAVVGVASLLIAGCGSQPQQAAGSAKAANKPKTSTTTPAPKSVAYTWYVVNGGNAAHPDWPFFSQDDKNPMPATITLPANATVTLTIKGYDDGGGTVPAAYAKVTGTVGNTETVNGTQESSFKASGQIAHTFTVTGLGLNIPVVAATDQGSTVVPSVTVVTFKTPAKAGTYSWQCYQPCGTGSAGWGGPMATPGWMMGTLQIQ